MTQYLLKLSGVGLLGWLFVQPQPCQGQESLRATFSARYREEADNSKGEPKSGERKHGTPVHLRITAVAIHLDKLRELGLDWDLSEEKLVEINDQRNGRFYKFVHSLAGGDSAQVLFAPHLSVVAGQKGSKQVSSWKVEVAPKFQENGDIQVVMTMTGTFRFPYSRSAASNGPLSVRPPDLSMELPLDLTKTLVFRPGETTFLARPKLEVKAASKPRRPQAETEPNAESNYDDKNSEDKKAITNDEPDVAVLLFAQVDTQPLDRPNAAPIVHPSVIAPSLTPGTPIYPAYPPYSNPRIPPPPTIVPPPPGMIPVTPAPAIIPSNAEY